MPAKLFIGTSGWNYPDWKGRFYPEGLKPKDYLSHYAKHFHTTEVNYSFYHVPRPTTYQNWAAQVPEDFVFSVKASRFITHIRRLREVAEAWQQFVQNATELGSRLGPILLQFPPSFKKNAELLSAFLLENRHLRESKGVYLAFEFRHASWFDREVCDILRKHGSALVVPIPCATPRPPSFLRLVSFTFDCTALAPSSLRHTP
jgi:uncharacterized protein YecE (DUF72 family)